jgi:hypothetical protein
MELQQSGLHTLMSVKELTIGESFHEAPIFNPIECVRNMLIATSCAVTISCT